MKLKFIDHIVIIVNDVKRTADFYSSFLGEPIQMDKEQVAFQVGETKLFFGLSYGGYEKQDKNKYGLNHLAFGVRSLEELKKFKGILDKNEVKNRGIKIDKYGKKEFIWFDDYEELEGVLFLFH